MGWTRRDFAATFQRMLEDRYIEVGRKVRARREELGYSQEALAAAAGVSTKTISRIETPPKNGPHEVRGSTFRKLAEALGVSVPELRAPLTVSASLTIEDESTPADRDASLRAEDALPDVELDDVGSSRQRSRRR